MLTPHRPARALMILATVAAATPGSPMGCSRGDSGRLTIGRPESLVVYEGLPHQFYEKDALNAELRTKDTVRLLGFPFYRKTLALEDADARAIGGLLGSADAFRPYSGEKRCGGFHPDYALRWPGVGEVTTVLLCFGCGEARIHGPDGDSLVDLSPEAARRLRERLTPYRENRPTPPNPSG